MLLPYLEQQAIFDQFDFSLHITDPANQTATRAVVSALHLPFRQPPAATPCKADASKPLRSTRPNRWGSGIRPRWGPLATDAATSVACVFCSEPVGGYCCADTADYGCCGNNGKPGVGIMDRAAHVVAFRDIRDGLSSTLMVGETIPKQCTFNGAYNHNFPIAGTTIPLNTFEESIEGVNNLWYRACGFKSRHPGGANFAMADGSVHFIGETVDYRLYNELGSRDGGEVVSLP